MEHGRRYALAAALCCLLAPVGASAAEKPSRTDPVVVEGGALGMLNGVAPGNVVAFRYRRTESGRHERWRQIPVQVDERAFVDFGSAPAGNATPGSDGTVYGTAPIGYGALQYTDPDTFVGADSNPHLDGDDEVVVMAGDAGDRSRRRTEPPKGVGSRGATRLKIADPLGGEPRFVYLFRSKGGLSPDAGRDYVDYDFSLSSGEYKSTYRRADGPNPETSRISTSVYDAGFSDRWYFDQLAIKAGGASSVDVLDGFKFGFGPNTCGRTEETFNDAEGAFVANVDGPVRAIRSYVGANSGPITERTHFFYRDRHEIVTDLRVHSGIPGPMTFHDLSAAGIGATYRDSTNPGGVPVDGVPDSLGDALPAWRLWTGSQGSLWSADRAEGSFAAELLAAARGWYLDDETPSNVQCWGDQQAYGQSGTWSTYPPPNTDPRIGGTATLRESTTDLMAAPGATAATGERWSSELDAPLEVAARRLER